jgi:NAD(P)-dependent dehydrogenase (short-subunit alcohol dehydrogenase family)
MRLAYLSPDVLERLLLWREPPSATLLQMVEATYLPWAEQRDREIIMDLGLRGLKALVTGGTRGIGRAIAETLAAEGCDMAICARNPKEVAATVTVLETRGVNVTGAAVDVSDGPMLKAWVAEAAAALYGIDIIVANVSALAVSDDDEGWSKGFCTDMMGTVRLVDAAMPFLLASKAAAATSQPVRVAASARAVGSAAASIGIGVLGNGCGLRRQSRFQDRPAASGPGPVSTGHALTTYSAPE